MYCCLLFTCTTTFFPNNYVFETFPQAWVFTQVLKIPLWLDLWTENRGQWGKLCGGSQELEGVQRCDSYCESRVLQSVLQSISVLQSVPNVHGLLHACLHFEAWWSAWYTLVDYLLFCQFQWLECRWWFWPAFENVFCGGSVLVKLEYMRYLCMVSGSSAMELMGMSLLQGSVRENRMQLFHLQMLISLLCPLAPLTLKWPLSGIERELLFSFLWFKLTEVSHTCFVNCASDQS